MIVNILNYRNTHKKKFQIFVKQLPQPTLSIVASGEGGIAWGRYNYHRKNNGAPSLSIR